MNRLLKAFIEILEDNRSELGGRKPGRSTGMVKAPDSFDDDLKLLDRYQAFSAEILRLSLLGITGVGFLAVKLAPVPGGPISSLLNFLYAARILLIGAALLFGCSATCALLHRYYSSDSMANQLLALRMEALGKSAAGARCDRNSSFRLSKRLIFSCAVFLAAASLTLVCSVGVAILG